MRHDFCCLLTLLAGMAMLPPTVNTLHSSSPVTAQRRVEFDAHRSSVRYGTVQLSQLWIRRIGGWRYHTILYDIASWTKLRGKGGKGDLHLSFFLSFFLFLEGDGDERYCTVLLQYLDSIRHLRSGTYLNVGFLWGRRRGRRRKNETFCDWGGVR
ncbi:hypothetical protein HOY82DRAFT_6442 [Tuber indicum]|nr:hypothetical protein HOY82DRAFT_6442 [Tuber indicum]